MSQVDPRIARACRHLDEDESLLASVVAGEIGGRRGRVVLVTNQRVLVAWTRPAPPDVLRLETCVARWAPGSGTLTLSDGARMISLADVEATAARKIVELLGTIADRPLAKRLAQALQPPKDT